jgi:hypothetical protein
MTDRCARCDGQRTLLQELLNVLRSKRRIDAATRDRFAVSITSYLVLGPAEVLGHAFAPCHSDGRGCGTMFWLSRCADSCHHRFVGGTVCGLGDQFHPIKARLGDVSEGRG